jgi:hypothetical protein
MGLAALAVAALMMSVTSTLAANSWEDCTRAKDADRVIRACTEVIADGRETSQNLAEAYTRRAMGYNEKKRLPGDC